MKKVKILTFHRAHNYGAVLQTYALQKKLTEMGYNAFVCDYRNLKIENRYKPICFKGKSIKKQVKNLIKYGLYHRKMNLRYKEFNKFINTKMNLSKSFYSIEDLENAVEENEIYISGSDQVWNKKIVGELSDIYTLKFNTKGGRKISYAASVGQDSLIDENKNEYYEKISKLDKISVREENTKKALEKIIIKKDITVVLDPTLLLSKNQWNEEINHTEIVVSEKYICAYVVQPDEEYIKIVNNLSEKTGLKVIHFDMRNPGYKNVLKSAYSEGPLEFVKYIKNAEYVVTTSFHATVFSVIFNKKFFCVPHKTTGSRVTNLLNKLDVKDRVYYNLEDFKDIDYKFETNWENVEKKLEQEREKSLNWLKNAIEG